MGDGRVTLMHAGKFGIGKPDAMAEHGAVADETLMIVVVEEILPLRERLVTKATSSRYSAMWVCRFNSGCSRHKAAAASSCAGVLDPAQRGVMA